MGSAKCVGMDVHKDTISIAVMNSAGKLIIESIIETKAITILQFIQGLQGDVKVMCGYLISHIYIRMGVVWPTQRV